MVVGGRALCAAAATPGGPGPQLLTQRLLTVSTAFVGMAVKGLLARGCDHPAPIVGGRALCAAAAALGGPGPQLLTQWLLTVGTAFVGMAVKGLLAKTCDHPAPL